MVPENSNKCHENKMLLRLLVQELFGLNKSHMNLFTEIFKIVSYCVFKEKSELRNNRTDRKYRLHV